MMLKRKNIARLLFDYAKSTQLYEIRVYDKNGWLIAFSRPGSISMGFVSFLKEKPVIRVSNDNNNWIVNKAIKSLPTLRVKTDIKTTKSYYINKYNIVGVESTENISRLYLDGISKILDRYLLLILLISLF